MVVFVCRMSSAVVPYLVVVVVEVVGRRLKVGLRAYGKSVTGS